MGAARAGSGTGWQCQLLLCVTGWLLGSGSNGSSGSGVTHLQCLHGLLASQRHLGGHHTLPIHDELAIGAAAFAPAAELLVPLDARDDAVIAAAGALGRAQQAAFLARDLLHFGEWEWSEETHWTRVYYIYAVVNCSALRIRLKGCSASRAYLKRAKQTIWQTGRQTGRQDRSDGHLS